ncbi:MAG: ribose-phosphate pyrophosphokinae [Bacteriovoracaceae bacterium]|nr:ribose-phosphate pyrophosphokinae [Bacteriovoracaceae bacterium]
MANQISVAIPYLGYSRQDRKIKPRDPVSTRYLAQIFEAAKVNCVISMDVHNLAAFQNAFRCATEHLEARSVFMDYLLSNLNFDGEITIVSPDAGGMKRVEEFCDALSQRISEPIQPAFMEKIRKDEKLSRSTLIGDVSNRTAIILDDMITTGSTLDRTVNACHQHGAKRIFAMATHGLFLESANSLLENPFLEKIITTNSLPPPQFDPKLLSQKLVQLDISPLFAKAIQRLHPLKGGQTG